MRCETLIDNIFILVLVRQKMSLYCKGLSIDKYRMCMKELGVYGKYQSVPVHSGESLPEPLPSSAVLSPAPSILFPPAGNNNELTVYYTIKRVHKSSSLMEK